MQTTLAANRIALAQHARTILTAWARGDRARLLDELERNTANGLAEGPDSERFELLAAIATTVIACELPPDADVDGDPAATACLGLLSRLIHERDEWN